MKEFDPFVVPTVHRYDVDRVLLEWERIESDIVWHTSEDGSSQSSQQYDPNANRGYVDGGSNRLLETLVRKSQTMIL